MILKVVLSFAFHPARLKDLNTCVSHICVILLSYMPGICLSMIYRLVKSSSSLVQNVLGNVFLLIPPLMNPIVYSVNTKAFHERIIRVFINKEQTLHKPMFLLLCMLALTDIGQSTCIVPKALCIFWFSSKGITVDGCLTQIFFVNVLGVTHLAVLVIMAFDRYVAICNPLRYATILTNARIVKLGLVGLIGSVLLNLPEILLLRRLPFCANHVIPHTYCEHIVVVKMSCGDTTVNRMYSLVILLLIIGLDMILIGLSYGLIIRAVLRISSKKANRKALNTCTPHICVMVMACTTGLFSTLTHRFGQGIAAHIHILLANLYILVPPMFNPIIYGVKIKELRDKVRTYICRM
ncbi:olfactory receptor 52P1-like [Emydura macquarii macquarii]|uniref:olfactory receptor 52P1-like n=1 Tax=Emydura macquarii macquarii TaxID=1129001 RepID=UPI00352B7D3F